MTKYLFTIFVVLLGGCQVINLHIFDSNAEKIELLNKIINQPEGIDSIIKNSEFYKEEVSYYFFKNTPGYITVVKFLENNKGRKVTLLYNKKFSITSYPVQGIYKDGEDIYFHEISYIYEDKQVNGLPNVILIRFEQRDSEWCFEALSIWNKEELDRLY